MMNREWVFHRGDLYLADLGTPVGSQQGGVRPVVVLQNNVGNYYAPTITVAPLTSKMKKADQPTHYTLREAYGLQKDSVVLAEHVMTLDKRCLVRYLGRVTSKATPHKDRLTALHAACLHLFRHTAQKLLDILPYACVVSSQSDEKSDGAIRTQSLCGAALKKCVVSTKRFGYSLDFMLRNVLRTDATILKPA